MGAQEEKPPSVEDRVADWPQEQNLEQGTPTEKAGQTGEDADKDASPRKVHGFAVWETLVTD